MTKQQRKTIEREFYRYAINKRNCGKVVNKVAYLSGAPNGERVNSSPGNSVENAMIRALNEDIRIHNWVAVFENTLHKFKWEQKDLLMQKRYVERQSVVQTCLELSIERRTYFYWVDSILAVAYMWARELKLL